MFIDKRLVDSTFTPPTRRVEDDDLEVSAKRNKSDAAIGVEPAVYSDSHAYTLTTSIVEEVKKLIESKIADDRKSEANTDLLARTVIKRLEYGSEGSDVVSYRMKLKKMERQYRDIARVATNVGELVGELKQKGCNSEVQKHILLTLATAASDGGRCSACVRRVLGVSRGISKKAKGRRLRFNELASVAPVIRMKKKEVDDDSSESEDSDYSDEDDSDLESNAGFSTDDDEEADDGGASESDSDDESVDGRMEVVDERKEEAGGGVQLGRGRRKGKKRKARATDNVFAEVFARDERNTRSDKFNWHQLQQWLHDEGARLDTCQLRKDPLLVEQPDGSLAMEDRRVQQESTKAMRVAFIASPYGVQSRIDNARTKINDDGTISKVPHPSTHPLTPVTVLIPLIPLTPLNPVDYEGYVGPVLEDVPQEHLRLRHRVGAARYSGHVGAAVAVPSEGDTHAPTQQRTCTTGDSGLCS